MGDVLSQSEIDELLKSLTSGEIDVTEITQDEPTERKIKNYDFSRPNKFAKDHLRTLHMIHENYSRLITNYLSGYLRTLVQIDVISVEQLTYHEFNNSITNPVILGIVEFAPLSGSVIYELAPNIAFSLIDRTLGGMGKTLEKLRTFTEIEISLIERIMYQLLYYLHEAWQNVIDLRPILERIETNSQFAQIISPNETVALITFSIRIGEVEGMMNLCIPHLVIEPIINKLSTRLWFTVKEKALSSETKNEIEEKINSVHIPIKAILGKTTFTVSELLDIQLGDVLQLNTELNSNIEVMVGDIHKFDAKPGVKKNKVSIKIVDVLRRDDD